MNLTTHSSNSKGRLLVQVQSHPRVWCKCAPSATKRRRRSITASWATNSRLWKNVAGTVTLSLCLATPPIRPSATTRLLRAMETMTNVFFLRMLLARSVGENLRSDFSSFYILGLHLREDFLIFHFWVIYLDLKNLQSLRMTVINVSVSARLATPVSSISGPCFSESRSQLKNASTQSKVSSALEGRSEEGEGLQLRRRCVLSEVVGSRKNLRDREPILTSFNRATRRNQFFLHNIESVQTQFPSRVNRFHRQVIPRHFQSIRRPRMTPGRSSKTRGTTPPSSWLTLRPSIAFCADCILNWPSRGCSTHAPPARRPPTSLSWRSTCQRAAPKHWGMTEQPLSVPFAITRSWCNGASTMKRGKIFQIEVQKHVIFVIC